MNPAIGARKYITEPHEANGKKRPIIGIAESEATAAAEAQVPPEKGFEHAPPRIQRIA